jgi:chemosensory pili system protein ChpA (sensor histidine kinase/response regulator)
MKGQNSFNLNSLAWVKHEITVSLDEAREEVLAYAENTAETEHLYEALPRIKDVYGTLEVADLSGAAMLAKESLAVVGGLAEGSIRNTEEASRLVVRALIQLPDYLDFVQSNHEDEPVVLVSILNDLKAIRNQEFISSDIIDIPVPDNDEAMLAGQGHSGESLQSLAHLTQHAFELGLLGWYRNQNDADSLHKMDLVCKRLRYASDYRASRRLWWLTEALITALKSNALSTSAAVKALIGKVGREIKRLFKVGEKEFAATISLELEKNLLYYVASAKPGNSVVDEVQKTYFLGGESSSTNAFTTAQVSMGGQNDQLYLSVAKAMSEDIEDIKDQLEVYSRAEQKSVDDLLLLEPLLGRLAGTLGMLGLSTQKDKVSEQKDKLTRVLAQRQHPDDVALAELAEMLVEIESTIASFGVLGREYVVADELGESHESLADKIDDEEYRKVRKPVLKESLVDIERCKEAIQIYGAENRDFKELDGIPEVFSNLAGAMSLLSLDTMVSLVSRISDFLNERIKEGRALSDAEIDDLAEAISGAEVYLEVMDTSGIDQQDYIDAGQRAMDSLLSGESIEALVDKSAVSEIDDFAEQDDLVQDTAAFSSEENLPAGELLDELTFSEAEEEVDSSLMPAIDARAIELESALANEPEGDGPLTVVGILPEDDKIAASFDLPERWRDLEVLRDGVDEEIYEIFLEEFAEESEKLKDGIKQLKADLTDEDALTQVRRSFHTLKGGGRLIGAQIVGEFAWLHEDILNQVIDHRLDLSDEVIGCVGGGIDLLPSLEMQLRARRAPDNAIAKQVLWAESVGKGQLDTNWQETEDISASPLGDEFLTEDVAADPDAIDLLQEELDSNWMDSESVSEQKEHSKLLNDGFLSERIAPELLEIFFAEITQHQAVIASVTEALRANGAAIEIDDKLLRTLHTMNGSARTAEVSEIHLPSGVFERYLSLKKEQALNLTLLDGELLSQFHLHVEEVLIALKENNATESGDELTLSLEHLSSELVSEGEMEADGIADTHEGSTKHEQVTGLGELSSTSEELLPMPGLSVPERQFIGADDHGSELIEVFFEECAEILETSDDIMNRWQSDPSDLAPVMELRRELHTLKGGARMSGLTGLGDLSHAMESLFIDVIEGRLAANKSVFAVVNGSFDRVNEIAEAAHNNMELSSVDDLIELLHKLRSGKSLTEEDFSVLRDYEPATETNIEINFASDAAKLSDIFESRLEESTVHVDVAKDPESQPHLPEAVKVQADLLDQLVDNIGEASVFQARVEQQVSSFGFNLQELDRTIRRLTDQLRSLEVEAEAQVLHRFEDKTINPDESGVYEQFDPLELDRYSKIQQLSRSLAESTSDLSNLQQLLEEGVSDVESLLQKQSRVNNDLQEGLMRTRMSPFKLMVPRLRRVVRRTAMELGKDVELKVNGADNEMDRKLLEGLVVPLEHMLRNAVAHGIENPDKRKEKGKPPMGSVEISISRQGPEVVFEVTDDGAGLDRDGILKKAVEQGILELDKKLTEAEIHALIVKPGFTTAEEVSQIAGRGVGMDVVQTQIKHLNGVLDINSQPGKGAAFRISLPFTLAINQALMVRAGTEKYAIPLDSIEGVVQLAGKSLVENLSSKNPQIEYGDKKYKLYQLASALERVAVTALDTERALPVILAQASEHSAAFVADELLGNSEVVVKSIGTLLSNVAGISGATILGDGNVVLILDTVGLIRAVASGINTAPAILARSEVEEDYRPVVMVVDDSITIRKVTARVLERNHYRVVTAKDGLDAIAQLKESPPDIMLLDIEMPRMDGFELAALIRNTKENEDLPIIMISSRSGRKHRERASRLGVNRFLGKPYQDNELLNNIESLLDESRVADGSTA